MMNEVMNTVTSTLVADENRLDFLPKFFGENLMLVGEGYIYSWMERLSVDYKGGYWNFYELSNGGFYMAPNSKKKMSLSVSGNYFEGEMSSDAAGITACLFALSAICSQFPSDKLVSAYHNLYEYIRFHPESDLIYQAID